MEDVHDITKYLNPKHTELFQNISRNLLAFGGYGAGKSYSAADKILLNPYWFKCRFKGVVIRKTLPSLKRTCIPLIEERADKFKIPIKYNRSSYIMRYGYNSEIHFMSINSNKEIEKIKSLTDVDFFWLEELPEITEESFDEIRLRLRGGSAPYAQIISTFNPISKVSWVYSKFFENKYRNTSKLHYTVYDNPFLLEKDPDYIEDLEALQHTNYSKYLIALKGEWGTLEGIVYDNYKIVDALPEKIDEVIYGLDFGYNDPNVLIKISRSDNKLYLEEIIFRTMLKNPELIQLIKNAGVGPYDPIYCDHKPEVIQEICDAGFNAKKGTKDVYDGVMFCKTQDLNIVDGSENMKKEVGGYVWATDKDGKNLDIPVKFQDHACDAFRYAIYTHFGKNRQRGAPKTNQRSKKTRSKVQNLPT